MVKPTSVWWWPTPRDGELVPDFPPTDITQCIADVQIEESDAEELVRGDEVPE